MTTYKSRRKGTAVKLNMCSRAVVSVGSNTTVPVSHLKKGTSKKGVSKN